jgi:putative hydrolase of the HAD superfamily
MTIRAIIFDLGGVVLGSPLHAIAEYEREIGLPANFVNRVVVDTAPGGAWSRLERGEISLEIFYADFEADCRAAGKTLSARSMFERMGAASLPRPIMLEAIRRLRAEGFQTAALTNNWAHDEQTDAEEVDGRAAVPASDGTRALSEFFDVFVESSVEGLRKPDPRIYTLTCERLDVDPSEAAFLDDIGSNLKAARALGMTTIKVDRPEQALQELSALIGLTLAD